MTDTEIPSFQASSALDLRVTLLEQEVRSLVAALEVLQDAARFNDLVLNRQSNLEHAALGRKVRLEAREFFEAGSGFHHLEYGDTGRPYRWTGAEPIASLRFWIDRSLPMTVRMGVHSFGLSSQVTLEIDGDRFSQTQAARGDILEFGPVSPRASAGPTELRVSCDAMFAPDAAGGGDTRHVGIALSHLELGPFTTA